jgi:ech hydrogenase subunit B
MMIVDFIVAVALALILAPIVGGLICGLDRVLTAWLQARIGPPVLQPFYDVFKLFGKTPMVVNPWQVFCAYVVLVSSALAVLLFFLQGNLLLIFFVLTMGAVFQVIGAMSVPSPYSHIGAHRELILMLTYEPLLILAFVGIAMKTGSFNVSAVFEQSTPLLPALPLLYLAMCTALTIKLRKSPFDISASHHGHQEVVSGVRTEYSGPHLALLEVAHWLDIILILAICSLFWASSALGMIILLLLTYVAEVVLDNITARLTWRWTLLYALGGGVAMSVANLLWLYAVA